MERRRKLSNGRRLEITVALIAAAGVISAAAVTGIFGLLSGGNSPTSASSGVHASGSANKNSCVAGSVVNGGTINCGLPTTVGSPVGPARTTLAGPPTTTADAGCGTPKERRGFSVRLRVVMWCAPFALRGQYEFKLKVSVSNTGH